MGVFDSSHNCNIFLNSPRLNSLLAESNSFVQTILFQLIGVRKCFQLNWMTKKLILKYKVINIWHKTHDSHSNYIYLCCTVSGIIKHRCLIVFKYIQQRKQRYPKCHGNKYKHCALCPSYVSHVHMSTHMKITCPLGNDSKTTNGLIWMYIFFVEESKWMDKSYMSILETFKTTE